MRKLLKKHGFAPKLLVADKLCSYAAAFRSARPLLEAAHRHRTATFFD
jgi:transposase-like protein